MLQNQTQRPRPLLPFALGAVALATVAGAFALRSSPVSHWRSAAGYDAFQAAYTEAMAEMPEPDETLDLRTDFGLVRLYRFTGSAEHSTPLLLVPGHGAGSAVWAENMPYLLELGDVYTVDLLGHAGMSVQERPIADSADQARWLHQALQQLPEEAFHLIGLSIGGWTATNYAVRHPELVASLSLIDPVFTFASISPEFVMRSFPASLPWLPNAWRDSFNSWMAGGGETNDVAVGRMIDAGQKHYSTNLPLPERISEQALGGLDLPVLAIIAEDSAVHDAQALVEVAQRTLRDGTVKLYAGASHAVSANEAERVAADFATLLEGN